MEVKSLLIQSEYRSPRCLEADVLEGPRFRLAEINFTGNHVCGRTPKQISPEEG
jgi:hypothetical protein